MIWLIVYLFKHLKICKPPFRNIFYTYCSINKYSKIVHQTFTIEEIVRGQQEIPREWPKPGKTMNPVDCIPNIDNFLKTFNLHNQCLKNQQNSLSSKTDWAHKKILQWTLRIGVQHKLLQKNTRSSQSWIWPWQPSCAIFLEDLWPATPEVLEICLFQMGWCWKDLFPVWLCHLHYQSIQKCIVFNRNIISSGFL